MITVADDGDNWPSSLPPVRPVPAGYVRVTDGKTARWVAPPGHKEYKGPPPGPHDAENARVREQQAVLDTARLYTSTKTYAGFPCAHRQWRHPGHCAFVHGYSRSFHFVFGCRELDECGFVVDFGALKSVRVYLDHLFDHTLLINRDDPLFQQFRNLALAGGCDLRILPHGVGMEGTARHVCEWTDDALRQQSKGRCWVVSVECRENEKNSAIYRNPNVGSPYSAAVAKALIGTQI